MQVQKVLSNRLILKPLEKISEHAVSFSAGISLLMALTVRPYVISKTPDTEKENKQYAQANSISSGLIKFGIVESVAIPVENAVRRIDKHPEKFLKPETIKNLSPRAYKFITQIIKQGAGFLTAVPKSILTVALIPVVMDKLLRNQCKNKPDKNEIKAGKISKEVAFTGLSERLSKSFAKIIDNSEVRRLAEKYKNQDKNIPKHITAATDILLTGTSTYQTSKSKGIKQERKRALIYNNIFSTSVTVFGGYAFDSAIKKKTDKFIDKFAVANKNDPKLGKYIEGLNILRPAMIFAAIYYGILPVLSTYFGEKADKWFKKSKIN